METGFSLSVGVSSSVCRAENCDRRKIEASRASVDRCCIILLASACCMSAQTLLHSAALGPEPYAQKCSDVTSSLGRIRLNAKDSMCCNYAALL